MRKITSIQLATKGKKKNQQKNSIVILGDGMVKTY